MPVLIAPETVNVADVQSLRGFDYVKVFEGRDATQLSHILDLVNAHWLNRNSSRSDSGNFVDGLVNNDPEIDWSELEDYRSVPFASAGKLKVRISGVTKLEPMPYPLDDIDLDGDLE